MNMKRNIFIAGGLIALGLIAILLFKPTSSVEAPSTLFQEYKNEALGLAFSYPAKLSVEESSGKIIASHSIPYRNSGCDMRGDSEVQERLSDFKLTFQMIDKDLVSAMKTISSYIPEENFENGMVKESPGFIDRATFGTVDGFAIFEGAEGCGHVIYYFPMGQSKTLVVTHDIVFEFSGVVAAERRDEVLAVPGVITPEEAEQIRDSILRSVEVK